MSVMPSTPSIHLAARSIVFVKYVRSYHHLPVTRANIGKRIVGEELVQDLANGINHPLNLARNECLAGVHVQVEILYGVRW